MFRREVRGPAAILLEHVGPAHDEDGGQGSVRLRRPEVGADRPTFERHVHDLHRRVEVQAGLAIGPRAVGADVGLHGRDLAREAADGVVRLGEEVGLARARMVARRLEPVARFLVALPRRPPARHPDVLRRPFEAGDDRAEFVEILDHRQPAAVEAALRDDEGVLVRRELERRCVSCSWVPSRLLFVGQRDLSDWTERN